MRDRRNISCSYNPRDLKCQGCDSAHSLGDAVKARQRVCISITDHNFPPLIAAGGDFNCIITIRVEDGKLEELLPTLDHVLLKNLGGRLAAGSVILIGSLSHLDALGPEAYTLDLARTMDAVGIKVGGGSTGPSSSSHPYEWPK
jgi:hypothetical protein